MPSTLEDLMHAIDQFAEERDWNQFHTPRNLAGSICIEGSELMELFQWDSPTKEDLAADQKKLAKVREELADVLNYALRFCSILGLDPLQPWKTNSALMDKNALLRKREDPQKVHEL